MSITATFETGTNGNTIAAADAGSATAFDAVSVGTGCTCAYDTTHKYDTLAAKIAVGATSTVVYVSWSTAFGTQTDSYGRLYIYLSGVPATGFKIVQLLNGASQAAALTLTAGGGNVVLRDQANTGQATSTNALATGQWTRIDYRVKHGTSTGIITAKLFNSPDSSTATETLTSTNINTLTQSTETRFGVCGATTSVTAFWLDNLVAAAAGFPGPAGTTSLTGIGIASGEAEGTPAAQRQEKPVGVVTAETVAAPKSMRIIAVV